MVRKVQGVMTRHPTVGASLWKSHGETDPSSQFGAWSDNGCKKLKILGQFLEITWRDWPSVQGAVTRFLGAWSGDSVESMKQEFNLTYILSSSNL